jgi:hypothetical protein
LRIAGADPILAPLFSPHALAKIHRYSQGLPRLINTICENALITAYARRLPAATAEIIEEVARDFRLDLSNAHGDAGTKIRSTIEAEEMPTVLDPYTSSREPVASGIGLEAPVVGEENK